jgi:hypothetical protein
MMAWYNHGVNSALTTGLMANASCYHLISLISGRRGPRIDGFSFAPRRFHCTPRLKTAEHLPEERCLEDLGLGFIKDHIRFDLYYRHLVHAVLRSA